MPNANEDYLCKIPASTSHPYPPPPPGPPPHTPLIDSPIQIAHTILIWITEPETLSSHFGFFSNGALKKTKNVSGFKPTWRTVNMLQIIICQWKWIFWPHKFFVLGHILSVPKAVWSVSPGFTCEFVFLMDSWLHDREKKKTCGVLSPHVHLMGVWPSHGRWIFASSPAA